MAPCLEGHIVLCLPPTLRHPVTHMTMPSTNQLLPCTSSCGRQEGERHKEAEEEGKVVNSGRLTPEGRSDLLLGWCFVFTSKSNYRRLLIRLGKRTGEWGKEPTPLNILFLSLNWSPMPLLALHGGGRGGGEREYFLLKENNSPARCSDGDTLEHETTTRGKV